MGAAEDCSSTFMTEFTMDHHVRTASDLLTREEAAEYLRVSMPSLTRWTGRKIPAVRLGTKVLFLRADLDAVIAAHRTPVDGINNNLETEEKE